MVRGTATRVDLSQLLSQLLCEELVTHLPSDDFADE